MTKEKKRRQHPWQVNIPMETRIAVKKAAVKSNMFENEWANMILFEAAQKVLTSKNEVARQDDVLSFEKLYELVIKIEQKVENIEKDKSRGILGLFRR